MKVPRVFVYGSKEVPYFCRVSNCRVIVGLHGGDFCQACGNIIAGVPQNAGIAGNLPTEFRKAVGRFYGTAWLGFLNGRKKVSRLKG